MWQFIKFHRNKIWVLGVAALGTVASPLILSFTPFGASYRWQLVALSALFAASFIAVLVICAQALMIKKLLTLEQTMMRLDQERELREKGLKELEEQLSGGMQVLSERIVQTKQSINDLMSHRAVSADRS